MIQAIIMIISLIVVGTGALLLVFKYNKINKYLLKLKHTSKIHITEESFNKLLTEVSRLPLENKIYILQATLGNKVNILMTVHNNNANITAVSVEEDLDLNRKDQYTG